MNIFKYDDYKAWLLKSLRDGKMKNGQQTALADAMGCRAGYLSRILNEDADLSLEQASDVADFFSLTIVEKSYLIALVGEKRAVKPSLSSYWKKKKQEAYAESLELHNRTTLEQHLTENQMMTYYSSWHYSAIHVAVGAPHLQTVDAISKYFQIAKSQVTKCLKFLCDVELVKKDGNQYVSFKNKIHLDKYSPLLQNHHLNWKHKTIEAMQDKRITDLNYMSVISISQKDYDALREVFLSTIERCRQITQKSEDEVVALYSVDIFQLDRQSQESSMQ